MSAANFQEGIEGIFHDLPAAAYHAAKGVSHSMLKNLHPTPAHLQAYLAEEHESTPAQIFGTLVHQRVLEPERPLPQLAVKTKAIDFKTSAGKAWRTEQQTAGRIIVTETELQNIEGCVNAIARHPRCREIFAEGRSEVSIFKNFSYGGTVLRKARLDWLPTGNSLVDIKTTQDASEESFAWEILKYRYYSQAAYYLDIVNDSLERAEKECFIFIAVEKNPPHGVAIYNLKPRAMGKGRERNLADLGTYMDCVEKNHWPSYGEEIISLDLPRYAYNEKPTLFP
ncbi:MAG TPA: PD-(D/E)XK nuclease-like domain-containing protein [Verrucomicrobiae bacterium]|nr:PD-(D/E)XK nuclease-like domain-containing protein [Verrucomicrobiae bacterium]